MKIFCIGFNKSGTTSIDALFRQWGMSSYHGMYSNWSLDDIRFDTYECFSDGEMHNFRALDTRFPGSKFILLSRTLDNWLISRIRHIEIRRARNKTGWMRKEYEENPSLAIKKWVARRSEYYSSVFEYFTGRPDQLFLLNICDSTDPHGDIVGLSNFLGRELSEGTHTFPHSRDSDSAARHVTNGRRILKFFQRSPVRDKSEVRAQIESNLSDLNIPRSVWRSDGLINQR